MSTYGSRDEVGKLTLIIFENVWINRRLKLRV